MLGIHPRESLNAAQTLQTALETLRARLGASLKRTGELIDQFKVWEAYCEHLRRPSHVTRDELRSIATMLRDRVPALRQEYALALCSFVSAGGQLGTHWLPLVGYYLRLGFRQELVPWRHWTPPATLRRWPSVYVLVYVTAWLLNAVLSVATVAFVLVALFVFIAEPIRTAGFQISPPAFLQALAVTLYIALSVYNCFGNPTTLLFSFWVTPWNLVSRVWQSLRALGKVAWRHLANLMRRLFPEPTQEGRVIVPEILPRLDVALPGQPPRRRTVPAVLWIVIALSVFSLLPFVGRETKDRIIAPPPVVRLPTPNPIAPWPRADPHPSPPAVSGKPDTYEQVLAEFETQIAAFRRDLKQFMQLEQGVTTAFAHVDVGSADRARDEYEAQTLDDNKFLDKLQKIRERGEALLARVRAMQAARTPLVQEASRLTAVVRSLELMPQSAGDGAAVLAAVGEELEVARRDLLAGKREFDQADADLVKLVSASVGYRYITGIEQARLQALRDDFELHRELATAALNRIDSIFERARTSREPLSQAIEDLRRQSAESLEALVKVDQSDSAGISGLRGIIATAETLKEGIAGGRRPIDEIFGTAHAAIEEIDQPSDEFAKGMAAMAQDHAKLVEEAALHAGVELSSLEEHMRVLRDRRDALAREQQRVRTDLKMLQTELDDMVRSASMQADDIAAKADAQLAAKGRGLIRVVGILIPLLLAGAYTVYQFRERRLVTKINASLDLGRLLQNATNSAHSLFLRRAAVNRIAGECFTDLEAFDKIKQACSSIERRGHRNDVWIAGALAREAWAIERRIKEVKSIL